MSKFIKLTPESGAFALFQLDHIVSVLKVYNSVNAQSVVTTINSEEYYVQETVEDIHAILAANGLSISVS